MAHKSNEVKISGEEIAELREAFSLFDKNNDGFINIRELRDIMLSLGNHPTDDELRAMIQEVDTDGDSKICFAEFLTMMGPSLKKSKQTVSNELQAVFKLFDRDGDGFITHAEMKMALIDLGEDVTDVEIDEMIQAADMDGDKRVNYQEFLSVMAKKKETNQCS